MSDTPKAVSPTCEVVTEWNQDRTEPLTFCGKPTVAFYPAMGGGTMALCEGHAAQHKYATRIDVPYAPLPSPEAPK